MQIKHKNPLCYASYEYGQICAACFINDDDVLECTALTDTDPYMEYCPFFYPRCVHRKNNKDGFKKCGATKNLYCENDCKYYKEVVKHE